MLLVLISRGKAAAGKLAEYNSPFSENYKTQSHRRTWGEDAFLGPFSVSVTLGWPREEGKYTHRGQLVPGDCSLYLSFMHWLEDRQYRNDFRFFTLKMQSPSSPFYLCYETGTFTGVCNLSFQSQTIFPRITFFLSNPSPSLCCIFFQAVSVSFKM